MAADPTSFRPNTNPMTYIAAAEAGRGPIDNPLLAWTTGTEQGLNYAIKETAYKQATDPQRLAAEKLERELRLDLLRAQVNKAEVDSSYAADQNRAAILASRMSAESSYQTALTKYQERKFAPVQAAADVSQKLSAAELNLAKTKEKTGGSQSSVVADITTPEGMARITEPPTQVTASQLTGQDNLQILSQSIQDLAKQTQTIMDTNTLSAQRNSQELQGRNALKDQALLNAGQNIVKNVQYQSDNGLLDDNKLPAIDSLVQLNEIYKGANSQGVKDQIKESAGYVFKTTGGIEALRNTIEAEIEDEEKKQSTLEALNNLADGSVPDSQFSLDQQSWKKLGVDPKLVSNPKLADQNLTALISGNYRSVTDPVMLDKYANHKYIQAVKKVSNNGKTGYSDVIEEGGTTTAGDVVGQTSRQVVFTSRDGTRQERVSFTEDPSDLAVLSLLRNKAEDFSDIGGTAQANIGQAQQAAKQQEAMKPTDAYTFNDNPNTPKNRPVEVAPGVTYTKMPALDRESLGVIPENTIIRTENTKADVPLYAYDEATRIKQTLLNRPGGERNLLNQDAIDNAEKSFNNFEKRFASVMEPYEKDFRENIVKGGRAQKSLYDDLTGILSFAEDNKLTDKFGAEGYLGRALTKTAAYIDAADPKTKQLVNRMSQYNANSMRELMATVGSRGADTENEKKMLMAAFDTEGLTYNVLKRTATLLEKDYIKKQEAQSLKDMLTERRYSKLDAYKVQRITNDYYKNDASSKYILKGDSYVENPNFMTAEEYLGFKLKQGPEQQAPTDAMAAKKKDETTITEPSTPPFESVEATPLEPQQQEGVLDKAYDALSGVGTALAEGAGRMGQAGVTPGATAAGIQPGTAGVEQTVAAMEAQEETWSEKYQNIVANKFKEDPAFGDKVNQMITEMENDPYTSRNILKKIPGGDYINTIKDTVSQAGANIANFVTRGGYDSILEAMDERNAKLFGVNPDDLKALREARNQQELKQIYVDHPWVATAVDGYISGKLMGYAGKAVESVAGLAAKAYKPVADLLKAVPTVGKVAEKGVSLTGRAGTAVGKELIETTAALAPIFGEDVKSQDVLLGTGLSAGLKGLGLAKNVITNTLKRSDPYKPMVSLMSNAGISKTRGKEIMKRYYDDVAAGIEDANILSYVTGPERDVVEGIVNSPEGIATFNEVKDNVNKMVSNISKQAETVGGYVKAPTTREATETLASELSKARQGVLAKTTAAKIGELEATGTQKAIYNLSDKLYAEGKGTAQEIVDDTYNIVKQFKDDVKAPKLPDQPGYTADMRPSDMYNDIADSLEEMSNTLKNPELKSAAYKQAVDDVATAVNPDLPTTKIEQYFSKQYPDMWAKAKEAAFKNKPDLGAQANTAKYYDELYKQGAEILREGGNKDLITKFRKDINDKAMRPIFEGAGKDPDTYMSILSTFSKFDDAVTSLDRHTEIARDTGLALQKGGATDLFNKFMGDAKKQKSLKEAIGADAFNKYKKEFKAIDYYTNTMQNIESASKAEVEKAFKDVSGFMNPINRNFGEELIDKASNPNLIKAVRDSLTTPEGKQSLTEAGRSYIKQRLDDFDRTKLSLETPKEIPMGDNFYQALGFKEQQWNNVKEMFGKDGAAILDEMFGRKINANNLKALMTPGEARGEGWSIKRMYNIVMRRALETNFKIGLDLATGMAIESMRKSDRRMIANMLYDPDPKKVADYIDTVFNMVNTVKKEGGYIVQEQAADKTISKPEVARFIVGVWANRRGKTEYDKAAFAAERYAAE